MDKTAYLDGYLIDPEPTAGTVADFLQENARHTLERTAGSAFPPYYDLVPSINATPPTIELDCSDPTAVVANVATLSADTTYWLTSADVTGGRPQGIKMIPSNDATRQCGFYWALSPAKDLTNYGICIDFYVYPGTDGELDSWHNCDGLSYSVKSAGGIASTTCWYGIGATETTPPVIAATDAVLMHSGWNRAYGLVGNATVVGLDQAAVTRIYISIDRGTQHLTGRPVFTIARCRLIPPPATPYWSLCLTPVTGPDGPANSLNLLAYLAQQRIKTLVGISPWLVGTTNQLTLDQCKQIYRMGHDICVYPDGPSAAAWSAHSESECVTYTRYAQAWLRDNGLGNGVSEYVVIPPGNGADDYDENTFSRKYCTIMLNAKADVKVGRPLYGANRGLQKFLTPLDTADGWNAWIGQTGWNGIKAAQGWMVFHSQCLAATLTLFRANLATLLSDTAAGTIKYISVCDAYLGRNL